MPYQSEICIDKSIGHICIQHFISMNVYSCSDIRGKHFPAGQNKMWAKKIGISSSRLEPIPII